MSTNYFLPGTNSGSQSWTNTALWSAGHAPATGEDIFLLTGSGINLDSGLNQGTVLLNSLTTSDNSPNIGSGTGSLQIGATIQRHGIPSTDGRKGTGASRLYIDTGTNQTTITLYTTATQSLDVGSPCACFKGVNASNAFYQVGGIAGLAAMLPTDTATFGAIEWGGGTLTVATGCTYSTFTANASGNDVATLQNGDNGVVLTVVGGDVTTTGVFAIGTATVYGGTLHPNHRPSSGTMFANVTLSGGTLDFTGNPAPFSFTTFARGAGNYLLFNDGQQTFGTITLPLNGLTKSNANLS